ncbi:hypothetical protein RRG08_016763 [Elysia crispata]|uniref:Uncharacterized protein n=1 Tax=Elysia crispata TaxID=231223 RepID=A0AAE0ZZ09_9GAST|nr:hypothetical protein RRG08_016763 [Elysia crispata]
MLHATPDKMKWMSTAHSSQTPPQFPRPHMIGQRVVYWTGISYSIFNPSIKTLSAALQLLKMSIIIKARTSDLAISQGSARADLWR